jgi:signal transduction histidine kinase
MDGFNVLADELRRNTTTEIHVRGDEPPDLPLATVADLLAIAREALANVARHADAGHATITVSGPDGAVRLEIADDGRGFAADADLSLGHHGLANMRTRAAGLGGTLDMESGAGEGTRIIVVIPRPGAREEEPSGG